MRVAGVILAGGRSRRMGGIDKFLLDLNGKPLIRHAIDRINPQVSRLAISANCDPKLLPAGYDVLPDALPSRGPLSGLLAGLRWAAAPPGITHLATAAADTPFLPSDLVDRLAGGIGDARAALASSIGRAHPTFGLWSTSLLPDLENHLSTSITSRVRDFANSVGAAVVEFGDGGDDPFFNVNDPVDLEAARLRLPQRHP